MVMKPLSDAERIARDTWLRERSARVTTLSATLTRNEKIAIWEKTANILSVWLLVFAEECQIKGAVPIAHTLAEIEGLLKNVSPQAGVVDSESAIDGPAEADKAVRRLYGLN